MRVPVLLLFSILAGCQTPDTTEGDTSASSGGTPGTTTSSSSSTTTSSSGDLDTSTGTTDATTGEPAPCNGSAALCERPFDAVVFPGTHNSVAATQSGFGPLNANQTNPVAEQLEDGIRVLLLDVTYDDDGETVLCHGPCALGSRPHVEVLAEIRAFLEDNPREVLSIIYQDSVAPEDIVADIESTDLLELVYTHDGASWPTLGEMIEADTRLLVTAEVAGPPPAWLHWVWDLAWDTPYTFTSLESFSCELGRGEQGNALFLLNHWLSTEAGLPDASRAAEANAADVLLARVHECRDSRGRTPTFIAVDFYEQGDLFEVVDMLNAEFSG